MNPEVEKLVRELRAYIEAPPVVTLKGIVTPSMNVEAVDPRQLMMRASNMLVLLNGQINQLTAALDEAKRHGPK